MDSVEDAAWITTPKDQDFGVFFRSQSLGKEYCWGVAKWIVVDIVKSCRM